MARILVVDDTAQNLTLIEIYLRGTEFEVVTAGSDRTARVWAADFDNPELLRAKIRATTTVCLTPARRVALLGEGAAEAEARHRDCEARAGR